jgi:hypothetical protein
MIDLLSKLGVYGGVGFLLGLALVAWIRPLTAGGVVLVMAIAIVVCVVVGKIAEFALRREHRGQD